MARARVVAPPPIDHIPEPLVSPPPPPEIVEEHAWIDGNLEEEEVEQNAPFQEKEVDEELICLRHDLERQMTIANEHVNKNEILRQEIEKLTREKETAENPPVVIETVVETVVETVHVQDPETLKEIEILRRENEQLTRIKEAAEKAKEEKILAARKKMTEQKGNQLNIVEQRKPSLLNRLKEYLRTRRIKKATVAVKNIETAIIERARIAVPKILDDMEKVHEELVILEELLAQYTSQKK